MEQYTIFCTEEQTKKAFELGAPIKTDIDEYGDIEAFAPTAAQMIGFILETDMGYSMDLANLIYEQGYKQGCLTFIDNCLK